jgi:hypothetical protein
MTHAPFCMSTCRLQQEKPSGQPLPELSHVLKHCPLTRTCPGGHCSPQTPGPHVVPHPLNTPPISVHLTSAKYWQLVPKQHAPLQHGSGEQDVAPAGTVPPRPVHVAGRTSLQL